MTALRNVGYLVQKELRQYFASPIAYVALAFWSFGVGFFFISNLGDFLQRSMMYEMRPGMYRPTTNDWVIAGSIFSMAVVGLFITPMITMRLLAEERRHGTIELLATSPITDLEIVLGKFFGALSLFVVMILSGLANFVFLWAYAEQGAAPDWRPLLTGALGLLLVGAMFISLGLFLSSLTRNQIIAGTVTFFVLLTLWLLGMIDNFLNGSIAQAIAYLGVPDHLRDLVRGVVDLKDVVFYISFTFYSFCR